MLFTCTPGQLAAHVLAKLAVLDYLLLTQLWEVALQKTNSSELDTLQKNVTWRSLTAGNALLFTIKTKNELLDSTPQALGDVLLHGSELEICIYPTAECQVRYLTGTENHQTMLASLGELPFQLLVVIARHGSEGILNPELARESGQDARSLRLRLQKLEAAGLIRCTSVYQNKTHTTHSIHVKFAVDGVVGKDSSEADEDLDSSRDVGKLKAKIMDALKAAPNQLRGFLDLCKELKLDGLHLASKFFRSVCLKLHRTGYVEKLHVELPETKQRVYAIKFVKDLPKGAEELAEYIDMNADEDEDREGDEGEGEGESEGGSESLKEASPVLNRVFPIFHQIFQQVYSRGEKGITLGEVAKNLLGVSEYKPYTRIYEAMPAYISNSKNLKPSKKYVDPYDNYTLSKLYDNEGKLKFYRYFVTPFCKEEKPQPKPYKPKRAVANESLVLLNKKLHSTLGKTSNEALIEKKRRLVETSEMPVKRQKPQKSEPREELGAKDLAELALEELPKRRKRTAPKSYATDDFMDLDGPESGDEYEPPANPEPEEPEDLDLALDAELEQELKVESTIPELSYNEPLLSSHDLPTFVTSSTKELRKRKPQPQTYKAESSVKSMTRRNILMDIIRQEGGAVFSSSGLCRTLDEKLGNTTLTDLKTLARDVVHLTNSGVLELRKVQVQTGNMPIERKLLVLTDPKERPSQAQIDKLVAKFAEQNSKKDMKIEPRRVIQSEMKLYVETPNKKKVSSGTRKRRGKNRLQALGDEVERESSVKDEPSDGVATPEPGDIMSSLKRSRRARKATVLLAQDTQATTAKRPRRNIRLDKSDATLLYRAVVISKAFSRDAIDFEGIASLVGDLDGKILKQKWGTLRRSFGGAGAVAKGVETFQNMIMQGIEDETITEQDLVDMDLEFFLNYWKSFDSSTELFVTDDMPLFTTSKQNHSVYDIAQSVMDSQTTGHYDRIEDISMRQKESVLSQSIFSYEPLGEPQAKPLDEVRSVLKAMFLAKEENAGLSKPILEHYGESMVREACNALVRDREISYVSFDADAKFLVGDKFNNSFVLKVFTPKFFHEAYAFKESLTSISKSGKGLILSQGIMPGQMASLLELVSENLVELIRIDRTLKFENYESRLIDKEQIACDIVVRCNHKEVSKIKNPPAPVPFRGPCQPIWIQLDSLVNKPIWTKTLVTLLYYIVFKPGMADFQLYNKIQSVLSLKDYEQVMEWLKATECISQTETGGYLASNKWQYILGQ